MACRMEVQHECGRSPLVQNINQFHLELLPETTLLETHRILDDVEDEVRAAFPNSDIIVHADPVGFEEMRDDF